MTKRIWYVFVGVIYILSLLVTGYNYFFLNIQPTNFDVLIVILTGMYIYTRKEQS